MQIMHVHTYTVYFLHQENLIKVAKLSVQKLGNDKRKVPSATLIQPHLQCICYDTVFI